jgi:hypothetical protein
VKFKNTLMLLGAFVVLLAAFLFLDKKGTKDTTAAPEEKLVALASADLQKITFKKENETLTFRKDDKGDWMAVEPLEVRADNYEVNQLAESFADLKIERVVEKEKADLKKYQIPQQEVTLWTKGKDQPVRILIGMVNPLDNSFFAQKEGDPRVVLISSALKTTLEKKFFDFRQKDIFKYETGEVKRIKLQAKDVAWEARKTDDGWFFEAPFKAMAKESRITAFLDTLSNLRAKEFISENKNVEEEKKFGLAAAEYKVVLSLPKTNKEMTFAVHKETDKTYVTTSESTKIAVPEIDPITELEKKADDYRENKIVTFNAWQANKAVLKKGALSLTLTKAANDKWYFDAAQKDEADGSKVEAFIRKFEGLEAAEYIDAPKSPSEYGLDKPQAEITVWTKDTGEKAVEKSFTVLVGQVNTEKKQAVVKNPKLNYFFRVDSAFIDEFPKEAKDWKAPLPEKKEPEKK